jgi:hypothetical protein
MHDVGLTKVRRDGFAWMDAEMAAGQPAGRVVKFSDKQLLVNANAELRVEVLDGAGNSIE